MVSRKQISLSRDSDPANRDRALCLLQASDPGPPEARAALVAGMDDTHREASLEALAGVAIRDPVTALPRVAMRLQGDWIDSMTLEAAAFLADPSLSPAIAAELGADQDGLFYEGLRDALTCCARGNPPEWRLLD